MNSWLPIPNFSKYEANENGQIRNCQTGKVLTTWGKGKKNDSSRDRRKIGLVDDLGKTKKLTVSRVVCAAKVGRQGESWEHVCHIDGDCTNDSMGNLKFADVINNAIDEVCIGRLATNLEYLEVAKNRIEELLIKLESKLLTLTEPDKMGPVHKLDYLPPTKERKELL